jgi:hypothetical protein
MSCPSVLQSNYEFGISRIVKSLEPYNKKLETDTWFYAKRCFLALIENLAKHMIMLKDSSFTEIMSFLDEVRSVTQTIQAWVSVGNHAAEESVEWSEDSKRESDCAMCTLLGGVQHQ